MSEVQTNSGFLAVIEFQILPAWFELGTRTQKDYANQLASLIERYPAVSVRWFDSDAWTSELSDFVMCEFQDLNAYNEFWSEMRRHPFLATPYAKIAHILMGMELETEGLARFADMPAAAKPQEQPGMLLPTSTGKPSKPNPGKLPSRPPQVDKPGKKDKDGPQKGPAERVCRYCGHSTKKTAKFCSRCGTPMELQDTIRLDNL